MKFIVVVLALAVIAIAQNVTIGVARVRGTTNDAGIDGYVTFTPTGDGNITISINISGITVNPNLNHGVHIHQFGDLSSGDGLSVGAHWNLTSGGANHGCPEINGTTRHIGDTGNWNVSGGVLIGTKSIDLIGLTGGINSVIGFAVIIHAATDDCATIASSGSRLAWGVIGIANPGIQSSGATQNLAAPIDTYTSNNGPTAAVCILQPAAAQTGAVGGATGYVYFSQVANGIQVSAVVNGLVDKTPRGIHIHQWGDLFNSTSQGNHYTGPYASSNSTHGIPGVTTSFHVGDMGNLRVIYDNGTAMFYGLYSNFGLYGSINNIIGRAVVIHNTTDNCGQPLGNAGARIAHCVIGPANPAYAGNWTQMTSVDSTQVCPAVTSGMMTSGMMTSGMMTSGMMTSGRVPTMTSGMMTAAVGTTGSSSIATFCVMLIIAAIFA